MYLLVKRFMKVVHTIDKAHAQCSWQMFCYMYVHVHILVLVSQAVHVNSTHE